MTTQIDTTAEAIGRLVDDLKHAAPESMAAVRGNAHRTLEALLARAEKAESDATNYRARMVEVEAERDNLRARLEAAEASCKEWVEAVRAVAAERSALLARLEAVESARNEREPRLWDCEQRLAAAQAEVARLQAGGCARDQRTTQYCAIAVDAQAREARLRWLLALTYTGVSLYADDGEMQDSTAHPFIDFKRDTPEEIERKIIERNRAALAQSQEQKGQP